MTMNNRSRARRAFTMVELMVGLVLGSIVILGAVAFAGHEVRVMGKGNQALEMSQVGRAAMDLLVADIINAGAGVGYRADGTFSGVEVANFMRGTQPHLTNNEP